jgi:hypothetical protein
MMAKRANLALAVDNTEQAVATEEKPTVYRLNFQDPIRTTSAEIAIVLNELGITANETMFKTFSKFTQERFIKVQ